MRNCIAVDRIDLHRCTVRDASSRALLCEPVFLSSEFSQARLTRNKENEHAGPDQYSTSSSAWDDGCWHQLDGIGVERTCPRAVRTTGTKAATRVASFDNIRQINAGTLNIGYAEAGPKNGPVVILLHGWPYDIYSFAEVTPLLAAAGYRVIVPYLRGYGSTRFLSADTPRNGQQAVVAVDIIALMDALKIDKAIFGGFDWGARTVNIIAALWPRAMQGDGLGERLSDRQPGSEPRAAAAEGRTRVVVSVLFRNRARPGGLRGEPSRLQQADLAYSRRRNGISTMRRSTARRSRSIIRITSRW